MNSSFDDNQTQQTEVARIVIEIAYATPQKQMIIEQLVAPDIDARQAVLDSNIDDFFPEIDKQSCDIGIFGKALRPGQTLEPGDRIEIYRPLIADPKEVRKQRAAQGLATKKGGGKSE